MCILLPVVLVFDSWIISVQFKERNKIFGGFLSQETVHNATILARVRTSNKEKKLSFSLCCHLLKHFVRYCNDIKGFFFLNREGQCSYVDYRVYQYRGNEINYDLMLRTTARHIK